MRSMQRLSRIDIRTRLSDADTQRFRLYADAHHMQPSEMAREAIIFFMDFHDHKLQVRQERTLSEQLQASTNRICALLAKVAIDVRAIYLCLAELDGIDSRNRMAGYRQAALKQISRVLTEAEKRVSEELTRNSRDA